MIAKLSERKKREADAMRGNRGDSTVSAEHLAASSRGMIKYTKAS